jgi:hypothetical protein
MHCSFTYFCCCIAPAGHSWDALWSSISQLVTKSLISVAPLLRHYYRAAVPMEHDFGK